METKKSRKDVHNSPMRLENRLDLVDRISALPDSILGLILSCLPTKNAVATTILSKRWKSVWFNVDNLDFCLEDWWNKLPKNVDMKFVQFVNRVLLLPDGGLLNKFRLKWGPRFIPSQVSKWINTAITRNVHHLFVSVRRSDELFDFHFCLLLEMPASVFNSDWLQCLELTGNIYVSTAIAVSLPRLETLKLVTVDFQSEEAFENLIRGCPLLNYLHLTIGSHKRSAFDPYVISSTSLRRLEVLFVFGYSRLGSPPSLQLKASSLEYFKLEGRLLKVCVQGCLSSLVEAYFRIRYDQTYLFEDFCNSVVKAVGAFDCAKVLTLSVDALLALSNATIGSTTKFTQLKKLKAEAMSCHCSSFFDLIQNSDSLEVLTIEQDPGNLQLELEDYDHDHSNWISHAEVPRCLSNSLKAVVFENYEGHDDEREMIAYLLKHGGALEVMQIASHSWNKKVSNMKLVEEICLFPRKSPACKLELFGYRTHGSIVNTNINFAALRYDM